MIRQDNAQFELKFWPRASGGRLLDLTSMIRVLTRTKSLDGSSVGTWTAALKPSTDADYAALLEARARLQDDDWGQLMVRSHDPRTGSDRVSLWEVMVDSPLRMVQAADGQGAVTRAWSVTGQDWSKAMTMGHARLNAIFSSAVTDYVSTEAGMVERTTTYTPSRMPGVIDVPQWESVTRAAMEGAALSLRADTPFRNLLGILLWGLYPDPSAENRTLLEKLEAHHWSGFGPVDGCPWQLGQLIGQQTITFDSLVRQFGNMTFNELFYTMTEVGPYPQIIYRERPYSRRAWNALPITEILDSQAPIIDVARSGAERYTGYKPMAAVAGLQGYDMLVDTAAGRLPIVDLPLLAAHGPRFADFADDFFPPAADATTEMLEWYRIRAGRQRDWYYYNPQYLTGSCTVAVADARLRIGERVLLPVEWDFLVGDRVISTQKIEAYVTNVSDTERVGEDGSISSSTTIRFVRGQPPGGLPLPALTPWVGKESVVVEKVLPSQARTGVLWINGVEVPVDFPVVDKRGVLIWSGARTGAVCQFVVHHTGGGSVLAAEMTMNNRKAEDGITPVPVSTHFIVDSEGACHQYFDPGLDVAYHAVAHNSQAVGADVVGGYPGVIPGPALRTMAALIKVVASQFPDLALTTYPYRPVGQSVADWTVENGISNLATVPAVLAHNQVDDNKWDPAASTAGNPGIWDQLRAALA